ncbi:hypothetical protein [Limnobaculum xujianqingii]|nr:hypothetical protein [Limnobaculum xujianqingii]
MLSVEEYASVAAEIDSSGKKATETNSKWLGLVRVVTKNSIQIS